MPSVVEFFYPSPSQLSRSVSAQSLSLGQLIHRIRLSFVVPTYRVYKIILYCSEEIYIVLRPPPWETVCRRRQDSRQDRGRWPAWSVVVCTCACACRINEEMYDYNYYYYRHHHRDRINQWRKTGCGGGACFKNRNVAFIYLYFVLLAV